MANFCPLSYLKIPRIDSDYGYQAATCVGDLLSGRVFYAKIDARDRSPTTKPWQADAPPTFTVTLFRDEDTTESIAIDVLKAGFARVDVRAASRRLAKPLLDDMLDAQESARRAHHGVWEYGDIDSDDEH